MTVAFGVPVTALVILAVFGAVVLLAAHEGLGSLASVVSGMWLASHQVPVSITEVTIGILPLAPTLLLAAGTARTVRRHSAERANQDLLPLLISALGGPLLITAVSLAVLMDAASTDPVQSPNALLSFGWTVAVHGIGIAFALAPRWFGLLVRRLHIAPDAIRAMRSGALAFGIVLGGAAIVVVIRLVLRFSTAREMFGTGNSALGYLGLLVLSLLYLPNIVIGTAGVLVGANAHVGPVTADLFNPHAGQVPPLPILSVLPAGSAVYAPLLFVVALVAAVWLGREADGWSLGARVRAVLIAAGAAATLMVLAAVLAGGELGVLGTAGVNIPAAGVFMFCWLGAGGTLATVVLGRDGVRPRGAPSWEDETSLPRPAVDEIEDAAQSPEPAFEDEVEPEFAGEDPADSTGPAYLTGSAQATEPDSAVEVDEEVVTEPFDRADEAPRESAERQTGSAPIDFDIDEDIDDADIDLILRNKN